MSQARSVELESEGIDPALKSRIEDLRGQQVADFPLIKGRLVLYIPGSCVPQDQFVSLGSPQDAGGEMLEGEIQLHARIDYAAGNMTCGIFQSTGVGKARVTLPFTEHVTILYGEVAMTDETGMRRVFREGDSYLVKQGSVIIWEQTVPLLQKSFFNVREA